MHVTNPCSNLTPVPRVRTGSEPGCKPLWSKTEGKRWEDNRGLSEHSFHISTPYVCVSTAF